MATPHITSNLEDIASTVIMPGDPLRARHIATTFLQDVKEVNSIRNMTAFTGYYKGKRVTVFPSGMGIPSMAIYAYELYQFYHVDTIIRVGTCGSFKEDIHLYDIILVDKSYSDSNFAKAYLGLDTNVSVGDSLLNETILSVAKTKNQKVHVGNVYCSECFYSLVKEENPIIKKYDCLSIEMESYALFHIANSLNKKASTVLTVSDSVVTQEQTSPEERQNKFNDMILLVLDAIL